ncbi:hypothetical protein TIFTF001_005575 [Ficus carica]|uniref:Plant heme peroxidase family profile domain-containing protein n=1 Tax=Ficus carica TaxID=3494 RepID=A0AA87ZM94_FICCA|nr:hypothetical protein TIFTF001_005575 [Ficus carica]
MATKVSPLVSSILLLLSISLSVNALSSNYYDHTCPQLESIVTHAGKNKAEKDGPPNISLHAFYVIDNAKKAIEASCPGVVSCADILALAARDAVALSGGPTWEVPKGRKDGRISKATETRQLPAPTFNISQLTQNFAQRGLSVTDLVALSGGHTLGFAHCSSFQNRIHSFSATLDVDPTLHPSFAASLRSVCPAHNKVKNAGTTLDSTTTIFDNAYYKLLLQGKSVFSSDQALLTTPKTKALVSNFACSKEEFEKAFVKSMIRMSSITGGGQEIRLDCKVVRGSRGIIRVPKPKILGWWLGGNPDRSASATTGVGERGDPIRCLGFEAKLDEGEDIGVRGVWVLRPSSVTVKTVGGRLDDGEDGGTQNGDLGRGLDSGKDRGGNSDLGFGGGGGSRLGVRGATPIWVRAWRVCEREGRREGE